METKPAIDRRASAVAALEKAEELMTRSERKKLTKYDTIIALLNVQVCLTDALVNLEFARDEEKNK